MKPKNNSDKFRCPWTKNDPQMVAYHDQEWGVPVHDDQKLFEFLVLESMQAGLSWSTILHKRQNFKKAFAGFDPKKIARFGKKDVNRLLGDEGIVRNRLKIEAVINNAACFIRIQKAFGSFDRYIWRFANFRSIKNRFRKHSQIPATTVLSDRISNDLKKQGFRFIGSTIVYAHMQATGMVNDHLVSCFRYNEIESVATTTSGR